MNRNELSRLSTLVRDNDIYLFGPMGVGKTTFIEELKCATDVNYVSMGDIARDKVANGDERVIKAIEKGGKIPLPLVQDLIVPHITMQASYVLDGVPRHVDEAEWIKQHISSRSLGTVAVTLSAHDDVIMGRILRRTDIGFRREDRERISARLQTYKDNHASVLEALRPALGEMIEIDTTNLLPTEVVEEFCGRI